VVDGVVMDVSFVGSDPGVGSVDAEPSPPSLMTRWRLVSALTWAPGWENDPTTTD